MFLVNDLIVLLASNLVLMQALGTSTLFIAAGSRKKLIAATAAITVFTTLGSAAAYFINSFTSQNSKFILLYYTLIIGVIYAALLIILYLINKNVFAKFKKYIHISAFNCAVMGTLFTVSERRNSFDGIGSYIFCGFEAGIGFIIAAFILAAAYDKLRSSKVPSSFRGFPAMLIYLGIISMAVYSLK